MNAIFLNVESLNEVVVQTSGDALVDVLRHFGGNIVDAVCVLLLTAAAQSDLTLNMFLLLDAEHSPPSGLVWVLQCF